MELLEYTFTHFISGTMILLIPLILRHKLDIVRIEILLMFFVCAHWVAIPSSVSPTLLTSATKRNQINKPNETTTQFTIYWGLS